MMPATMLRNAKPAAAQTTRGNIRAGAATSSWAQLSSPTIAADTSIYSYGYICAGEGSGNCTAAGGTGVGLASTGSNVYGSVYLTGIGNSYFDGGNVGIGTTSPLATLSIGPAISDTNNSTAFIAGEPTLGSTLDAMDYVGEFRSASANQDRLLFAEHRTVATGSPSWTTAAWRIQPAVDNSFTTVASNEGYIELAHGTSGSYHGIGLSGQGNTAPDLIVNGSGYVGIGTTSPTYLLDVGAGPSGSGLSIARVNGGTSGTGSGAALFFGNNGTNNNAIGNYSAVYGGSTAYNTALTLYSSGNVLIPSGNVGIGTTAPGALFTVGNNTFEVNSAGNVTATQGTINGQLLVNGELYQESNYAYLGNYNSGGTYPTFGNGLAIADNFSSGLAEMDVWNTVSPTTFTTTGIRFLQQTGASTYTDIMFLKNNGSVGIGTTSPQSKLHIQSGEVQVGSSGASCASANAGAIRYSGGTLHYCDNLNTWESIDSSGGADTGDYYIATGTATPTSGEGMFGGSATLGAVLAGYGSISDTTLENRSNTPALEVLANSTNVYMPGNVGIGTASPTSSLTLYGTTPVNSFSFGTGDNIVYPIMTSAAVMAPSSGSNVYANAYFDTQANATVSTGTIASVDVQVFDAATTGSSQPTLIGVTSNARHLGSGTLANLQGGSFTANNRSTGTVASSIGVLGTANNNTTTGAATTTMVGAEGVVNNNVTSATAYTAAAMYGSVQNTTGTMTDAYGAYISFANTGTIGQGYGVYITGVGTGTNTSTGYDLYAGDSGVYNYFAGNVGIGTASPVSPLTVYGSGGSYGTVMQVVNPGGVNQVDISASINSYGLLLGSDPSSEGVSGYHGPQYGYLINVANAPLMLGANNSVDMTILPSGNVGIAATSPQNKLDVSGAEVIGASYAGSYVAPSSLR